MWLMAENRFYPVVIVPGIGQSKVVVADEKGERLRGAWPLEIDPDAVSALKGPGRNGMFIINCGFR